MPNYCHRIALSGADAETNDLPPASIGSELAFLPSPSSIGNYTFLTSEMVVARPNVHASRKRHFLGGISNVHQNRIPSPTASRLRRLPCFQRSHRPQSHFSPYWKTIVVPSFSVIVYT